MTTPQTIQGLMMYGVLISFFLSMGLSKWSKQYLDTEALQKCKGIDLSRHGLFTPRKLITKKGRILRDAAIVSFISSLLLVIALAIYVGESAQQ